MTDASSYQEARERVAKRIVEYDGLHDDNVLIMRVGDLRALLAGPPLPDREVLARVIDPAAFKTYREIAAGAGLDASNPPPNVIFPCGIDEPVPERVGQRTASLSKADTIIALLKGEKTPKP